MNIGEYLRCEREQRGISLEHIAEETKISLRHLRAMEEGRLETLPSKVFVKGFIKAYSKCIGLDPVEVIYRYEESLRGAVPPVQKVAEPKAFVPDTEKKEDLPRKEPFKFPEIRISGRAVFFIIVALVVVLSAVFSMKR